MENQKNNKGVIALLIVIIVILSTLCILFATDTISFNTNKENDNDRNKLLTIKTMKQTTINLCLQYVQPKIMIN